MMWKNRNVWIVLIGEFIAGLGLWLGIIGNLEFMQQYVPSDFMKSLILFIGLLAGVLIGPLAGNVIDRFRKKGILLYASMGRILSVGFMFVAIAKEDILFMILFLITIQLSAAFYFPALQALIPMIVREEKLLDMNRIHMNVATVARIAGTALAGVLLTFVNLNILYVGSMVGYIGLFIFTCFLQVNGDEKHQALPKEKTKAKFMDVFPVLKENKIALKALLLTIVPMLFIGGFNLMVIEISEWHDDASVKGLIYTIEGVAFLLGTFIVKKIADLVDNEKLMSLLASLVAAAHLSLYFSFNEMMTYLSFALFGLAVGCFFPIVATVFQTKVDKSYHGRLFSFRSMFDRILFQIILLLTGLCLDTVGLQTMVLLFGAFSFLLIGSVSLRKQHVSSQSSSV